MAPQTVAYLNRNIVEFREQIKLAAGGKTLDLNRNIVEFRGRFFQTSGRGFRS